MCLPSICMCLPYIIPNPKATTSKRSYPVAERPSQSNRPRATVPEQTSENDCPSNRQSDQLRATVSHHPRESSQRIISERPSRSDRLRATFTPEEKLLGLKEAASVLEDRTDRRGSTLMWPGCRRSKEPALLQIVSCVKVQFGTMYLQVFAF